MNAGTGFVWFFVVMWLAWRIFLWSERRRTWLASQHDRCPDCGQYATACSTCGRSIPRQVFDEEE